MTAPFTAPERYGEMLSMIIMLLTMPRMMNPTTVPTSRPFPPASEVPPTITAVMASNSYWAPEVAAATAAIRDISMTAATAVQSPTSM